MIRDVLFAPVLIIYVAVLAAMFAYGLNFVYLTIASLRARQPRRPVEPPSVWPVVTVQLPLYNEMYVAGRLIDAVAAMDYPRDRFEVQVLDDSSDETADVVAAATRRWRDAGVDIVHVRRGERTGYKAGALAAGLARARGELVAIFDADFVPSPSFLRDAVSVLAADPRLAFVQARWGHINRGSSLLTKLQALAIDGHFGIEQRGRSSRGHWFNFNGTAGIWRRVALVDAGGWQHDTLTEDLDVSYRAFLAGWSAAYLPSLEAPAELPVSFSAFRRQQHRWARGSFECAAKHLGAVWRAPVPLGRKVSATLHLTGYAIHLLLLTMAVLYPLLLFVSATHADLFAALGVLSVFNITSLAPTLMFAIGQRQVGRRWLRQLPMILLLSVFGCGLMVNTARAAWQALRGQPAAFERTPKYGVRDRSDRWHQSRYQLGVDRIVIVEGALVVLDVVTVVVAATRGVWVVAVYSTIFATGLAGAVTATLRQAARTSVGLMGRTVPAVS